MVIKAKRSDTYVVRRRRHRSRHDGAVAHLAQPPAAAPRCRDSLTARWLTGQAKNPLCVAAERDVDCQPDLAHSCWASSSLAPHPHLLHLPTSPHHLHPPHLHTHLLHRTHPTCTPTPTHTHTYPHTRTCARLCSRPSYARSRSHGQHLGLYIRTPPNEQAPSRCGRIPLGQPSGLA